MVRVAGGLTPKDMKWQPWEWFTGSLYCTKMLFLRLFASRDFGFVLRIKTMVYVFEAKEARGRDRQLGGILQ